MKTDDTAKSIRQQLLGIGNIEQKPNESESKFIKRLVRVISDENVVTDNDWDSLSEEAQEWHTQAVEAITNKKELPGFEDEEADKIEQGPDELIDGKKGKKAKKKKTSKSKGTSGTGQKKGKIYRLKEMMIVTFMKGEIIKSDILAQALEDEGFNSSKATMNSFYSDTRMTLNMLKEMNLLQPKK